MLLYRQPMADMMVAHDEGVGIMYLNGDTLITGGKDDAVRMWDVSEYPFKETATVRNVGKWVWGVYFDDEVVMSCARDRVLRIWPRASIVGECVNRRMLFSYSAPSALTGLQVAGNVIAVSSLDGILRCWSGTGGSFLSPSLSVSLKAHSAGIFSLAFDGPHIITGSKDGTAKVWDLSSEAMLASLGGHQGMIHALAVDAPRQLIVTGAADGRVCLWDTRSYALQTAIRGHECHVKTAQVIGNALVTSAKDALVHMWDMRRLSDVPLQVLRGHKQAIYGVAVRETDLVTASLDGMLGLWSYGEPEPRAAD